MKLWITRHGQTDLNKKKLMQGRVDEKLNETGRQQARDARTRSGEVVFDAVYASPLDRAQETASIIGGVERSEIVVDPRIIETDFGPYERRPYTRMGPAMTFYWALPEVFPAPKGVETIASMTARSSSFLQELQEKDHENVLIVCHGGIIRALCGFLEDRRNGIKWRPKPKNCEIRVYEYDPEMHTHRFLGKR